jgi:hypothetical protein
MSLSAELRDGSLDGLTDTPSPTRSPTAPDTRTLFIVSQIPRFHWLFDGGSVWESNPPFDPRRAESPALKAGKITGPLSPPMRV